MYFPTRWNPKNFVVSSKKAVSNVNCGNTVRKVLIILVFLNNGQAVLRFISTRRNPDWSNISIKVLVFNVNCENGIRKCLWFRLLETGKKSNRGCPCTSLSATEPVQLYCKHEDAIYNVNCGSSVRMSMICLARGTKTINRKIFIFGKLESSLDDMWRPCGGSGNLGVWGQQQMRGTSIRWATCPPDDLSVWGWFRMHGKSEWLGGFHG